MFVCPKCSKRLSRVRTRFGVAYVCSSCTGRAVKTDTLKRGARPGFVRELRHTRGRSLRQERRCPMCSRPMAVVEHVGENGIVVLDACWLCRLIWFDPSEYERVQPAAIRPELAPPGPGDDGPKFGLFWPERPWQFLPGILGLPIEFGQNRLRSAPLATLTLAFVMVTLFVLLYFGWPVTLERAIGQLGFVPDQWSRHGGMTIALSFLLHAGWWHLIGNLYFFIVFGDNVEDHLGPWRFLMLLFGSHLGGLLLHALRGGVGEMPCVGASAGISGLLAYYAIVFTRAKIGICPSLFFALVLRFRFVRMPAVAGLVFYVALQLLGASAEGRTASGIGYFAHLGGLAVGAIVGLLVRASQREPRMSLQASAR